MQNKGMEIMLSFTRPNSPRFVNPRWRLNKNPPALQASRLVVISKWESNISNICVCQDVLEFHLVDWQHRIPHQLSPFPLLPPQ